MSNVVRTLPTPLALDDFELGVTLGTGSFGRVRFCTHKVHKTVMFYPKYSILHYPLFTFFLLLFFFFPFFSSETLYSGDGIFLGHENAEESRSHQASAGWLPLI